MYSADSGSAYIECNFKEVCDLFDFFSACWDSCALLQNLAACQKVLCIWRKTFTAARGSFRNRLCSRRSFCCDCHLRFNSCVSTAACLPYIDWSGQLARLNRVHWKITVKNLYFCNAIVNSTFQMAHSFKLSCWTAENSMAAIIVTVKIQIHIYIIYIIHISNWLMVSIYHCWAYPYETKTGTVFNIFFVGTYEERSDYIFLMLSKSGGNI